MKIALINGSPRFGKSNSGSLLGRLEPLLGEGHEISRYSLNKGRLLPEEYQRICGSDALVFAFPLYIDAIPSNMFRVLVELERRLKAETHGGIRVYAIANNGFFEGIQNHIAFRILENWCARAGVTYGQGIGQGAGEMVGELENVPLGKGPNKNLGFALRALAGSIAGGTSGETAFISPNFPRFAWKAMGTLDWQSTAKKNGLKKRDLLARH